MGNLRLRHRPEPRSRNRRGRLRPVMQGTAGFFSTVNTKETDWALTEQDTENEKDWTLQRNNKNTKIIVNRRKDTGRVKPWCKPNNVPYFLTKWRVGTVYFTLFPGRFEIEYPSN